MTVSDPAETLKLDTDVCHHGRVFLASLLTLSDKKRIEDILALGPSHQMILGVTGAIHIERPQSFGPCRITLLPLLNELILDAHTHIIGS